MRPTPPVTVGDSKQNRRQQCRGASPVISTFQLIGVVAISSHGSIGSVTNLLFVIHLIRLHDGVDSW